jgi:hypothetical protein
MDAAGQSGADVARMARAYENSVYIVAGNIGPFVGEPDGPLRPPSEILDYTGKVIASGPNDSEGWISATIDLPSLRRHRATVGANPLAQLQPALHLPVYATADIFPSNGWAERPIQDELENVAMERRVLERMLEHGVLMPPEDSG